MQTSNNMRTFNPKRYADEKCEFCLGEGVIEHDPLGPEEIANTETCICSAINYEDSQHYMYDEWRDEGRL